MISFREERYARTFPIPVNGTLVVGVAAVLFVGVVYGDGAAVRVGVEQEERLEVIFDAFADHVFPPGANLQQTDDGQQVFLATRAPSGTPLQYWCLPRLHSTKEEQVLGRNCVFWGTGSTPVGFLRGCKYNQKKAAWVSVTETSFHSSLI